MSTQQMYFADSEVFAHDNLWVFKRQSDGRCEVFWNDPDGVADFIEVEQPVLCGFNFRDYDQWILKATLLGWTPEQVKVVNDTIITCDDRSLVWALFDGSPFVAIPPIIDLIHDVVPRKGLKEIEANVGMSIVESSVPFDIDRPLTEDEQDEVLRYCLHDISATERLYDLRYEYLKAKADLCEMGDIDPLTMLKHTNARIVAEVLGAEKLPFEITHGDQPEPYVVPGNLDTTAIPADVLAFVESIHSHNCEYNDREVEFMFHGCPTKVGLGGIHAAVPAYKETSTPQRAVLIQDIGSYYPSLIIRNGYMSRAVPDASAYERFYRMRMEAKAAGDKATAEAAKLVLNTTYGTMKDTFNKMYDPMQGTRVCLSGQLYILDLIENLFRVTTTLQLIQLNTDGWVVSVDRDELDAVTGAVEAWQERTGFTVDTDFIDTIVQANVNNYVMRTVGDSVKAKGGVVSKHAGGDFKSNSATIIDKAVVDYLLDGTPIESTVADCDDITRFQIVAKAGRSFAKVVATQIDEQTDMPEETEVQRVNRVYATTEEDYGGIFKVKCDAEGVETTRSRIPLTPEHCAVDNENLWKSTPIHLTTLDRSWYVSLAKRKAREFITRDKKEREQMATASEKHNENEAPKAEPRRKANKSDTPDETPDTTSETLLTPVFRPFGERLLALMVTMAEASKGVSFDKVVNGINHEYADTQQYKLWLAQKCAALGLVFGFDITKTEFLGVINPPTDNKSSMYGVLVEGRVVIADAYEDGTGNRAAAVYGVSGLGINTTAGYALGGAQTNALRNFILNNYLLDNMGRDGDDIGLAAMDSTTGYVAPDKKAEIRQEIADKKAEEKKYATKLFMDALRDKIIEAQAIDPEFGVKTIKKHYEADGKPKLQENGKSTMEKSKAVQRLAQAEEIVAKGGE